MRRRQMYADKPKTADPPATFDWSAAGSEVIPPGPTVYMCAICQKTLPTWRGLNLHMVRMHKNGDKS